MGSDLLKLLGYQIVVTQLEAKSSPEAMVVTLVWTKIVKKAQTK